VGGIVAPPIVGALLTSGEAFPSVLLTGVPIGIAAIVLIFIGEETRERSLEQISEV
jgi:hypothetical protein